MKREYDVESGCTQRHIHGAHCHNEQGIPQKSGQACCCGHEHTHAQGAGGAHWVRLILGALLFGVGILVRNLWEIPQWGDFAVFAVAYLILGGNVLLTAGKNIIKGKVFDENFLMTIATVGAFILGDYMEGTAVMLFYLVGEMLSDRAVEKSKASITALMEIRPDYANVERNGKAERVDPRTVKIGDTILIKPGEKVPLDSVVTEGRSTLDTSALTGESMPREAEAGSGILAGCVNGGGLLRARVQKEYGQSTAAKILDIVENASSKKAPAEKFITRFARYYTPIVCAAAVIVAVVPSLVTGAWDVWVYRALLFLVISCPCALVVSVPLSYFGGIGGASRKGILVKGANDLEALNGVTEVVFDKTGTLTRGVFAVQAVGAEPGYTREEVLAATAAAESNSTHPIAKSVMAAWGKQTGEMQIKGHTEMAGQGVSVSFEGKTILAGNAKLMQNEQVAFTPVEEPGTVLYVAQNGKYMGFILIADQLKEDAKRAVKELTGMGIRTAMLTGDNRKIGSRVAKEAGIGEAYCELLPQEKVSVLEMIAKSNQKTAFAGDGINDAPVLARADVGIAMGALGSDAAIEAADVVLMTDEPTKIPEAIRIAKRTKRIVIQNILFALIVKSAVMVLGVVGLTDMWWAVFADVGVTLIAVLNALRALKG